MHHAATVFGQVDDTGGKGVAVWVGRATTIIPAHLAKGCLLLLKLLPASRIKQRLSTAGSFDANFFWVLKKFWLAIGPQVMFFKFSGAVGSNSTIATL